MNSKNLVKIGAVVLSQISIGLSAFAGTAIYQVDIVSPNIQIEDFLSKAKFVSDGKISSVDVTANSLREDQVGDKKRIRGIVRIEGEQVNSFGRFGVDVNEDGRISMTEPHFVAHEDGDNAVAATLEFSCGLALVPVLAHQRRQYQISIVELKDGTTLWGPEVIDSVISNDCRMTVILGRNMPISDALKRRNHAELGFRIVDVGSPALEQIVRVYHPLGGGIGPRGPAGRSGPMGPQGEKGDKGEVGFAGPAGPTGPTGARGFAGESGQPGPRGPAGSTGPRGLSGEQGPMGANGMPGPQGSRGMSGERGTPGPAGPRGIQGERGPAGPTGPTGP